MKIGIYLGYGPKTVLGKEGLGRYLGSLIRNLQLTGNQVTVACPEWLLDTLDKLLNDFNIRKDEIDFIVAKKIPILWKVYNNKMGSKKKGKAGKLEKLFQRGVELGINGFLSITNIIIFVVLLLLMFCMAIIAVPFVLIGVFFLWLFQIVRCIKNKSGNVIRSASTHILNIYKEVGDSRLNAFAQIYNRFMDNVQNQLIGKINKNQEMDIWYSPAVFWPSFNKISGKKVINVPDLVTAEYALKWGERGEILYSSKQCEETIDDGEYFVVYSQYVKDTLLVNKFGKCADHIKVIPHSINQLSQYINIDSGIAGKMGLQDVFTDAFCKVTIQALATHTTGINEYIKTFCFDDVDYIFYPSQARPHKNLLNLLKAYEYLLRKKYVRIKLFLTCRLDILPEVRDYIYNRRLQYDVISFYDVDTKELAALYHRAKLIVTPTFYEGGFPFTFGEGFSVGVPSVMSDIPQVREMISGFELEDMLFDPYNVSDIIDKIIYGLNNREHLLEKEQKLYNWWLSEYSPEKVGEMYVQAFEEFATV